MKPECDVVDCSALAIAMVACVKVECLFLELTYVAFAFVLKYGLVPGNDVIFHRLMDDLND